MELGSIRFALAVYVTVLLAAVTRWLPYASLRHAWSALGGLLIVRFVFRSDAWLSICGVAGACYAVMWLTRPFRALDAWRHWASAFVAFGCLTVRHMMRTNVTAINIDDSVLFMVLAVKLYALAYNVYDGTVDKARLEAVVADEAASSSARKVAADRLSRSIPALPSPLEFAGYVFNFCTVLAGPSFEIGEYLASQRREELPPTSRFMPALWTFLLSTAFTVVMVVGGTYFKIDEVYAQAVAAVEGSSDAAPLWKRYLYAHCALTLVRVQYYSVWKLAETASVIAGFGYRAHGSVDPAAAATAAADTHDRHRSSDSVAGGKPDWAGVANVHPLSVETSTGLNHTLRHWNVFTQSWLERYIFRRAPRGMNKWITFGASAFWHGFYPGYYLSFVSVPVVQVRKLCTVQEVFILLLVQQHLEASYSLCCMQEVSRSVFHTLRPLITGKQGGSYHRKHGIEYRAYVVLKWAITMLTFDYFLIPFVMLDWNRPLLVWKSWHYYGHVGAIVAWVLVQLIAAATSGGSSQRPKTA